MKICRSYPRPTESTILIKGLEIHILQALAVSLGLASKNICFNEVEAMFWEEEYSSGKIEAIRIKHKWVTS